MQPGIDTTKVITSSKKTIFTAVFLSIGLITAGIIYFTNHTSSSKTSVSSVRANNMCDDKTYVNYIEAFAKPERVCYLSISDESSEPTIHPEINRFRNLKYLSISNIPITMLESPVKELTKLEVLELNNTALQFLPSFINYFEKLKKLNLEGSPIVDLPDLSNLADLEEININKTAITEFPYALLDTNELTILKMSNLKITGLSSEIGKLDTLKELYVSNNALTVVPDSIGNLGELEVLDLSFNQLTGLPITIENLTNLKKIILTGNRFNAESIVNIQRQLPGTQIVN